MRKSILLPLAALLAALVAAPAAPAALPKTKSKTIAVGKSVAGVKLGMTMAKAAKVWKMEEGNGCFPLMPGAPLTCMFEVSPSGANYHTGNISYTGRKKVGEIRLRTPNDGSNQLFEGPMLKYKTTKKAGRIGLGSTVSKLRSQYGAKLKQVYRNAATVVFQVKGPKKAKTDFVFVGGGGAQDRAATIEMYFGKSHY